jgi:membrane protein YqaA with SNARE-associated domain
MFLWAVAEATVWPLIPDALLAPMVIGSRRSLPRLLIAAIAGSALGGIVLYAYAFAQPQAALVALPTLPTISRDTIERADHLLAEWGDYAFVIQPVSGIPFKVVAVLAAARAMDPQRVLLLSIAARTARMCLTGVVAALVAWRFHPSLRDHFLVLAGLYLVLTGIAWWVTQR